MKKISFVLIAALALLALTGCPTAHDDLEWASYAIVGCIAGGGNDWPVTFEQEITDDGALGTIEWTWDGTQAWNEANECPDKKGVAFQILAEPDNWTGAFHGGKVELGKGYATLDDEAEYYNAYFSGLEKGTTYIISVLADWKGKVQVKIDKK